MQFERALIVTHPYLDQPGPPRPIAFAHRGYSARHPENTLAAFEAAVALGYHYLETDVHVSRDGQLLAFHDDRLDRVTDRSGIIAEMDWAEISKARVLGGQGNRSELGEPIPLFEELLRQFPETKLNIEPKSDAAVPLLAQVLKQHQALDRTCIGSFSRPRLARTRALLGDGACTSHSPFDVARLRLASYGPGGLGFPVGKFPGQCLQIPVSRFGFRLVDRAFLRAAHARGLKVHVWTINEQPEMNRLLDLGIDGIMSDDAVLLKEVMQERGLWQA